MTDMDKLVLLQKNLAPQLGFKIDVYRQEGYGVLAVPSGQPLHPVNVVYSMSELMFQDTFI